MMIIIIATIIITVIKNKGNREEKKRERLNESNNALLQYCNKQSIECFHIYKSYIFCICTT